MENLAQGALEFLDLHSRLFHGDAIAFLQPAGKVVAISIAAPDVVIRELVPLCLEPLTQRRPFVAYHVLDHFIVLSGAACVDDLASTALEFI